MRVAGSDVGAGSDCRSSCRRGMTAVGLRLNWETVPCTTRLEGRVLERGMSKVLLLKAVFFTQSVCMGA